MYKMIRGKVTDEQKENILRCKKFYDAVKLYYMKDNERLAVFYSNFHSFKRTPNERFAEFEEILSVNPNAAELRESFQKEFYLFDQISNEILIKLYGNSKRKLMQCGFIETVPGNFSQIYHYDFECNTENIFIPLCELTDLNGTELIDFENMVSKCRDINATIRDDGVRKISDFNILKEHLSSYHDVKEVKQRFVNCQPFDIIQLPYYQLHRAQENRGGYNRVMFHICSTDQVDYDFDLQSNHDMFIKETY